MIKIVFCELLKITQRKVTLAVIACLIVVSGCITHYQINHKPDYGYSTRDSYSVYQETADLSDLEKLALLEHEIDSYYQAINDAGPGFRIDYDEMIRVQIYNEMIEELESIIGYSDYLQGIDDRAQSMLQSPLFGTPGTFSYRSIESTPSAYEHLKGLSVSHDFSKGVLLVTDNPVTDIFMFTSLAILAMHLIISEREEGILALLKTTRNGLSKTVLAKLATLFALTFLAVLFFYGLTLLVVVNEISLGDLYRPIQSVTGYLSSPYRITVLEYLLLFFSVKVLFTCALMFVFFAICLICRNIVYSVLAGVVVFGIQTALFTGISPYSAFSFLSRFNLAALIDVGYCFSDYLNINLFDWPVNINVISAVTTVFSIVVSTAVSTCRFVKERSSSAIELVRFRLNIKPPLTFGLHTSILRHEAYKLFVMNKALIVALAFTVFQVWSYTQIEYLIYNEEYYYQVYSERLEGRSSAANERFLEAETTRFEAIEENKQAIYDAYEAGEITLDAATFAISRLEPDPGQQRAFYRARNQYMGLFGIPHRGGSNASYIYQTGWDILVGPESAYNTLMIYLKIFMVLIICLSSIGAVEEATGMVILMGTTLLTQRSVTIRKAFLSGCLAVVVALSSVLPNVIVVFDKFMTTELQFRASARSLSYLGWVPDSISVTVYLLLCILLCLLISILAALLILVISRKTKNTIVTMLVSTAVLVIPIALMLLL